MSELWTGSTTFHWSLSCLLYMSHAAHTMPRPFCSLFPSRMQFQCYTSTLVPVLRARIFGSISTCMLPARVPIGSGWTDGFGSAAYGRSARSAARWRTNDIACKTFCTARAVTLARAAAFLTRASDMPSNACACRATLHATVCSSALPARQRAILTFCAHTVHNTPPPFSSTACRRARAPRATRGAW